MVSSKSIQIGLKSRLFACHQIPAKTKVKDALKTYGCDLTDLAGQVGELDWSLGRHDEVQRMILVLYNQRTRNPLLIGEPGVGKIDVVRELAHELISRVYVTCDFLNNVRLIAFDIEDLMSTDGLLEAVLKEVQEDPVRKVILFIDNIHFVFDDGQPKWSYDAVCLLLHTIATGKLWCIGGTTLEGHKKYLSKHPVFKESIFEKVSVAELGVSPHQSFKHQYSASKKITGLSGRK